LIGYEDPFDAAL